MGLFSKFRKETRNQENRQQNATSVPTRTEIIKKVVFEGILKSRNSMAWTPEMIGVFVEREFGEEALDLLSDLDDEILFRIDNMKNGLDDQMKEYLAQNPDRVVEFIDFTANNAIETAQRNQYLPEKARNFIDMNASYQGFKQMLQEQQQEQEQENDRSDYSRSYRSMDDGFDR